MYQSFWFKKITRIVSSLLPAQANRLGSCNRCGQCCKLVFRCPFLREDQDNNFHCAAYKFRPPHCRQFPRTQAQLDIVKDSCGYAFASNSIVVSIKKAKKLAKKAA